MRTVTVVGIIDLSGSMNGQPLGMVQNQIQSLLPELQSAQRYTAGTIRLGLIGFNTRAWWLMKPKAVERIPEVPSLRIQADQRGLYPGSSFAVMSRAMKSVLKQMPPTDSGHSVHLLLLSDLMVTDPDETLKEELASLCEDAAFQKCTRYVIRDAAEHKNDTYRVGLGAAFAGKNGIVTDPSGISDVFSRLTLTLNSADSESGGAS